MTPGVRFSKTGKEIKEAVGKRIDQLQQRLSRRNAALEEFLNDRPLVRSYLVRVAAERMTHGYPGTRLCTRSPKSPASKLKKSARFANGSTNWSKKSPGYG